MFRRLLNLPKQHSFLLLGARGVGKTKYLESHFDRTNSVWVDLLDPEQEDRYIKRPNDFKALLANAHEGISWIVIDEVQKAPALLNIVHKEVEKKRFLFALTGSSARKLKRGKANLLAGRAYSIKMYPLTHREIGSEFILEKALGYGTLPEPYLSSTQEESSAFLRTYTDTFLREEIFAEQLVRALPTFRKFLDIAGQMNGKILNFSAIARDIGADPNTIKTYFEILEDTLIGILLRPFHKSLRKRQSQSPKFYFFDCGISRALDRTLRVPLEQSSYAYGILFEQFVILEAIRLNEYKNLDFRFSYLRTKDDSEIDLIIERPGLPTALIEIKSASQLREDHVSTLLRFVKDLPNYEAYCLSNDKEPKRFGQVQCHHWIEGLRELGL